MQPSAYFLFIIHKMLHPKSIFSILHRRRSRFIAGKCIFLPINGIFLTDNFSLW